VGRNALFPFLLPLSFSSRRRLHIINSKIYSEPGGWIKGADAMIAQTMVEYGALQSISAAFMNAFHRVEIFLGSGNSRYFLFLGIAFFVVLIWTRRRTG
jgi:hypothetical protein